MESVQLNRIIEKAVFAIFDIVENTWLQSRSGREGKHTYDFGEHLSGQDKGEA